MASEQAAQIGARLRARREEMGLTRRQLALKMQGLATENDLYRWETGKHKPQDDTLAAIAGALGRDYAWAVAATPNGETPQLFRDSEGDQLDRIEHKLDEIYELLTAEPLDDVASGDDEVEPGEGLADAVRGAASRVGAAVPSPPAPETSRPTTHPAGPQRKTA